MSELAYNYYSQFKLNYTDNTKERDDQTIRLG